MRRDRSSVEVPAELARAQRQFEAWRQQHRPRTRIPEQLWDAAVSAAEASGLYRTSRQLRLSYATLKQHVAMRQRRSEQPNSSSTDFIEVMPVLGAQAQRWTLDLCNQGGDTLHLEMHGGATLDVQSLASVVLSRRG